MVLALFLRLGGLNPHTMRLRLFAVKANANREQNLPSLLGQLCRDAAFAYSKKKRWVLCVSNHQSVILVSFFSLCLKRGYRKKGKIGWCIGLHLEGSSPLRWTIRSPFKSTVHFYRECERVMVCGWDWGKIDSQSCTVVPKMYLRTSLYLSIFAKISSKSRIFTLFNKEKS